VERAKFAKHVMVSAGVCYGKAKVNGKLYCKILLNRTLKMQVVFAIWFHIPAARSTCSHGVAGSKLDFYQLQ